MWATPFATDNGKPVYELVGSTARPRARRSSAPRSIIDPDIEEATGTSPDLAVSSTGQADVVYRVVRAQQHDRPAAASRRCRGAGARRALRRASAGRTWARSIATRASRCARPPPRTRRRSRSARPATASSSGRSRNRRRRAHLGTAPLRKHARLRDAGQRRRPSTARRSARTPKRRASRSRGSARPRSPTGSAAGAGSPLPGPRIFLNILPDGESASGSEFLGASVADNAVAGGKLASIGPPEHRHRRTAQDMRLLYDANGTPRVVEGNDHGLTGTLSLGPPFARQRSRPRRA